MARRLPWPKEPRARKPVVAVVGGAIIALGLVMIVLPGPAILVIPLGLIVLAMEFQCARRWLRTARHRLLRRVRLPPHPVGST